MRDHLVDIVKNTHGLGIINLVKVTGTEKDTIIEAVSDDRAVVVQAKFNNPMPEFIGVFGMPNLGKLNTILNIPEYKENAKITLTKKPGETVADGLNFENASGDFKNSFRFMGGNVADEKIKSGKFKNVKWNVEFEPTVTNITRLKYQASANAEELNFIAKTEGSDLKFFFGNHSNHAGSFVFQSNVVGTLSKGWLWPVNAIQSILALPGDKMYRISDEGATQITVCTELSTYNYILPAQSK